ncbi:MAG: KH domain-containing protein [Defluviitaleaceae bacterium]|nr:KH domain-containing protein [Defluviitaleaceae bacterium]
MKELLEIIAKGLVDKPDEVRVTETMDGKQTRLRLHVAKDDMGKVIGRQGRIAKAIRAVVKASAIHKNEHVFVEIGDKSTPETSESDGDE